MSCSCCSLCLLASFLMRRSPLSTLFPYTTLFRSSDSIDARRANDSTVNSSRARTGPPGGPPPLLTDTGTDKEPARSEEHTSELQSRGHLVCRLLLEKKNKSKKKGNLSKVYIQ